MGIFDDILGGVDDILESEEFQMGDSIDIGSVSSPSEAEKATNIWNARDNGKAWSTGTAPKAAWTSSRNIDPVDEDEEDFGDDGYDDDDDEFDDDWEEFPDDDDEETVVLHHSVFNL